MSTWRRTNIRDDESPAVRLDRWIRSGRTLASMTMVSWDDVPPVDLLGSLITVLMSIASLLCSAMAEADVLIKEVIRHGANSELLCVESTVSAYAPIAFPDLRDVATDGAGARDLFQEFFIKMTEVILDPDGVYRIADETSSQAAMLLLSAVRAIPIRRSFLLDRQMRRWWPIVDNLQSIQLTSPACANHVASRLLRWTGPCRQCSECEGEWHTTSVDPDGEMTVYNHNNGSLFEAGPNNLCGLCEKVILTCSEEGIPMSCPYCVGLVMCYQCEEGHMLEHEEEESG